MSGNDGNRVNWGPEQLLYYQEWGWQVPVSTALVTKERTVMLSPVTAGQAAQGGEEVSLLPKAAS